MYRRRVRLLFVLFGSYGLCDFYFLISALIITLYNIGTRMGKGSIKKSTWLRLVTVRPIEQISPFFKIQKFIE